MDGTTVVRFLRRAEIAPQLDRNEATVSLAASSLGPELAVPQITVYGFPSEHVPYRFFGHVRSSIQPPGAFGGLGGAPLAALPSRSSRC